MSLRSLLSALLLASSAVLTAPGSLASAAAETRIHVTTIGGADFDLARLRGHVVVIHFWATWCPPCIKEMPALGAFYERYRARGVEVLALSEDRTRDIDQVQHMVHHMNAGYPVAMAHNASANSFGDPAALPVTYVLDAHGAVRAEMRPDTQPVTEESLARIVDPLLATP